MTSTTTPRHGSSLAGARVVLVVVLGLVACEEPGFQVVKAADGARALQVKCTKSADDCLEEARTACRRGYDVVDSESHQAALLSDDLPGQTVWYSLTFRCTAASTSARPSFPFRGARSDTTASMGQTPAAADHESASSADARGRSAPTRGCAMDSDCGGGAVCAKPVGSAEGVCARSVDSSGLPNGASPRFGSGAAGQRECLGAMDCGIGFRCDQGRCFKR